MIILEAIKGYYVEESVIFLIGDKVKVTGMEEGIIYLEGIDGWCKGIELSFSPRIVVESFKYLTSQD